WHSYLACWQQENCERRGHLNAKDSHLQSSQGPPPVKDIDETDLLETLSSVQANNIGPRYETTERIFRLLHLLTANDCSRDDIFGRLKDYYKIGEGDDPRVRASSQRAGRMLRRDLQFLEKMGLQIN